MRKRQLSMPLLESSSSPGTEWLDLETKAVVEVTSEEPDYPVESALISEQRQGWRAASPGTQTIRLIFDQPQRLKHISVFIEDDQSTRTQEFVLRWSPYNASWFREIVRQQWNFNPEATHEIEEYQCELSDVGVLELVIVPDISGGQARASLKRLRIR